MSKYQVHQTDANEAAIIDALKAGGCSVVKISRPVDLAVGKNGRSYLAEVKRPKAKLRATQVKFIAEWRGHVCVFRSVEDVQHFLREL